MQSKSSPTKGWPPLHLTKVPTGDIERGDGRIVCRRIETLCTVSKDGYAARSGTPLELRPWQKQLILRLFARRADGRYRHRAALIGMPRKNGKSSLGSGFALDGLIYGGMGAEVYSAAADRPQARIVFGETKRTVKANAELDERCNVMRDVIEDPVTGSIYRVLSSDAFRQEGLNISRALVDELHAHPTDELWNVLTLGSAGRIDPLTIAITTAGVKSDRSGRDSVCYRMFQYGKKVASGEIDDPSFFFAWWGAPDESDHRSAEVWEAANPGYGDLIDPEDFESSVRRTPESEFRTKRLNQWVSSQATWLPAGAWASLADSSISIEDKARVTLGFDGSRNGDSTALVITTIDSTPHVDLIGMWERPADAGPDWQVPRAEVLSAMREACLTYDVAGIAADAYLWQSELQELELEGLPIEAVTQNASRMVPATQRFYEAVMSRSLTHSGNAALSRHIDNAVLRVTQAGSQLSKDKSGSPRKIDGAVAAVMALDLASTLMEPEGEVHIW